MRKPFDMVQYANKLLAGVSRGQLHSETCTCDACTRSWFCSNDAEHDHGDSSYPRATVRGGLCEACQKAKVQK